MSYTELTLKVVTCKKKHRCEWCNEVIEIGEKAKYRSYIFDSDFMAGHMHIECFDAMTDLPPYDLENGWCPGDFKRGENEER